MQGFRIIVDIDNVPEGIRFRLYDNGALVLDDIGNMDFQYLTPVEYEGLHTLTMTYFDEINPAKESAPKTIFTRDFTLPDLTYSVTVEII